MRESYESLIDYVRTVTGVSWNRTWSILKEYSTVLKQAVKRGNDLDIEGLVEISFETPKGFIYQNSVYGFDQQAKDVAHNLNLDVLEVRNILITYLRRIKSRILDGYHVNIKGVCYLIPENRDDSVICVTRVSPVLSKPEVVDLLLVTDKGIVIQEVEEKDLRFIIQEKESITYLYNVAEEKSKKLNLPKVNI